MFRTLSPGDSVLVALRKVIQGTRKGVRIYTSLQRSEQAVWTSKMRYQIKEVSILCMGRWKPLGSMNSFLAHAPQLSGANPVFLAHLKEWEIALLASPQLLSYHCGEWWHLLDLSFGNPYSHLEARNCWWLWHFLLIDMAGAISTLHWHLTVMLLMFQQNRPFSMRCYVGVLDCHSGVTAWTHHVVVDGRGQSEWRSD